MNGTCDWTCNCLALSKVLRAACLPCQHCQSYSVRGSRVLHACGKAYSLLSCYSGSAQLSCWPFTGTGQHCGCRQVQHYWQQCRCVAPTPCDTGQSSTGPGGGGKGGQHHPSPALTKLECAAVVNPVLSGACGVVTPSRCMAPPRCGRSWCPWSSTTGDPSNRFIMGCAVRE